MSDWIALAGYLGVTALAAAAGAAFRPDAWYEGLTKPAWQPPKRIFAPVWSVIYILIAVAGWCLSRHDVYEEATLLWAIQLAFNAAWAPLFFGAKRIDLAFADVCLLWLAIVATLLVAVQLDTIAALLLVPYLAWVSFAVLLNFAVWRLNGDGAAEELH